MQTDGSVRGGHDLAIACVFRDSMFFLPEWIEFHRMMGATRFYLCDHLSDDDASAFLADRYGGTSLVAYERCDRDFDASFEEEVHVPFFRRAIQRARGEGVRWLALLDSDEFLMPSRAEDADVVTVLRRHEDKAAVCVNWQLYGTSGVDRLPVGSTILETFTLKAPTDDPINRHVKCVVRPELVENLISPFPHTVKPVAGWRCATTDGTPVKGATSARVVVDELRLNHYNTGDVRYFETYKVPFYRRYVPPGPRQEEVCGRARNGAFSQVDDATASSRFARDVAARVVSTRCVFVFVRGGTAPDGGIHDVIGPHWWKTHVVIVLPARPTDDQRAVATELLNGSPSSSAGAMDVVDLVPGMGDEDLQRTFLMDAARKGWPKYRTIVTIVLTEAGGLEYRGATHRGDTEGVFSDKAH